MFKLPFGLGKASPPQGEIATTIIDVATNTVAPEMDWPAVFSVVEMIKAYYTKPNPNEGCTQALAAIKYRLDSDDAVAISYTLLLLDTCFKNCDRPFQVAVGSKDFTKFVQKLLEKPSLAAENRGQFLEIIANWASSTDVPEIRQLFLALVKAGYRFSPQALAKLTPQEIADINRAPTFTQSLFFSQPTAVVVPYSIPVALQQPIMASPAPRPDISQVSLEERTKWVSHDIALAETSVAMLVETMNFAEPGKDIATNEIAIESYNRCLEIQKRIVSHIERVQESDLLDKLITSNTSIVGALVQFNAMHASAKNNTNLVNVAESPAREPVPSAAAQPILAAPAVPPIAVQKNNGLEDPFADQ